jgi:FlaA1/EpsC-like NDP-sugar epimerase
MEKIRFRAITLLADIVFLTVSFLVMVWIKPASLRSYLPSHTPFFIVLALIWIIVSLVNGKMHRHKVTNFTNLLTRVLTSNIIAISITALIMYSTREYTYSRTIVLGTALLTTFLELLFGSMYMAYKKAVVHDYEEYDRFKQYKPSEYELVNGTNGNGNGNHTSEPADVNPKIIRALEKECGSEMTEAIIEMTGHKLNDRTAVLSTTTIFNITD